MLEDRRGFSHFYVMDQAQAVSSSETEEYRALKMKEILEHVFGFCDIDDLKMCRLVSSFWRECSLKAFKSFHVVKLTSATKTREFVRILKDPRPAAGSRVELYKNFVLSHSSLTRSSQSTTFWTVTGSHIKSLELYNIELETVSEFRNIVLNICRNLKELTLRNVSLAEHGQVVIVEPTEWETPQFGENKNLSSLTLNQLPPESLDISCMEFVNYFPSLKALSLEEAVPFHFYLINAVRKTRVHDATRLELNEIHFSFADQQTARVEPNDLIVGVIALSKTGLPWRKLSLDLNGGSHPSPDDNLISIGFVMVNILGSNTVEKLTISRCQGENLDPLCSLFYPVYPVLNFENLQELELKAPVFTSMWFVKLMPNLRKLSFCQPNFSADQDYPAETDLHGVQLNKLVELKANCKISLEGLELLVNLFPNVEHLEMELDNDMFRLVCERWPNLVSLYIVDSAVDECGITGMDEDDVKRINDQRRKSKWKPITVRRANITSLKHLRYVFLQADYRLPPFGNPFNRFLGYCGKMHGFEETPNLEEVAIFNYIFEKKAYKDVFAFVGGRKIPFIIFPASDVFVQYYDP